MSAAAISSQVPLNPFGVAAAIHDGMDKSSIAINCVINGERKLLGKQPVKILMWFQMNASVSLKRIHIFINILEKMASQAGCLAFVETVPIEQILLGQIEDFNFHHASVPRCVSLPFPNQ